LLTQTKSYPKAKEIKVNQSESFLIFPKGKGRKEMQFGTWNASQISILPSLSYPNDWFLIFESGTLATSNVVLSRLMVLLSHIFHAAIST
jgi:hypothetical protein